MQGLPACQPATPYRYVLLHLWVITITRRSVNLAITSAALTFTALQARVGNLQSPCFKLFMRLSVHVWQQALRQLVIALARKYSAILLTLCMMRVYAINVLYTLLHNGALCSMLLQSASLVLTTTPPEELALGLSSLLTPLRLIGAPVKEIGKDDLLSSFAFLITQLAVTPQWTF